MSKQTHVVDLASWRAKELSSVCEVDYSYGLWIPPHQPGDAWWIPQAIAAHLNLSLQHWGQEPIFFNSPGVNLLPETPPNFLQRTVELFTVAEALHNPKAGWWKPAEAKINNFPAQHYTKENLLNTINNVKGLPASTQLHYCETTLPIVEEHRCFVVNSEVRSQSLYRRVEADGSEVFFDENPEDKYFTEVTEFANKVAKSLNSSPLSYVMDVARLSDASYAVLEYNPSWCSGWYNCELTGVLEALQRVSDDSNEWQWMPAEYHTNRAKHWQPLPLKS